MLTIRRSEDRGRVDLGWLDGRHSFSFADYYDPQHMGFRALRVINDDRIAPGGGFPTHPHRDMEIVTYMISGALEHRDSVGGQGVIRAGEAQRMTAGSGVRHSEFNADPSASARLLQIWILPEQRGLAPSYEQRAFSAEEKRGRLRPVATPDGRDDSLTIRQDATIYAAILAEGETVRHRLAPGRGAWAQVARGRLTINGVALEEGDGLAIEDEADITLAGGPQQAEVLLFDLA